MRLKDYNRRRTIFLIFAAAIGLWAVGMIVAMTFGIGSIPAQFYASSIMLAVGIGVPFYLGYQENGFIAGVKSSFGAVVAYLIIAAILAVIL